MPTTLTPVDQFEAYPLTNMPVPGEDCTAELFQDIFQDVHDRIYHLKTSLTSTQGDLTDLESSFSDLSDLVSGYAASLAAAVQDITDIETALGSISLPIGWTGCEYVEINDTYKSAIEHLDEQIVANTDTLAEISETLEDVPDQIASIANKLSETAYNGLPGLDLSGEFYYAEDLTAEAALVRINAILEVFRHQTEVTKTLQAENWEVANTDSTLIYDWLTADTNINGTYSTADCFDETKQTFGKTGGAWTFYSTVQTVPEGTNTVKIKWSVNPGTVTASVILDGNYASTFEDIASQDAWVTVTDGTQLIVKFSGTDGAYLTGYQLLHKVVAP